MAQFDWSENEIVLLYCIVKQLEIIFISSIVKYMDGFLWHDEQKLHGKGRKRFLTVVLFPTLHTVSNHWIHTVTCYLR